MTSIDQLHRNNDVEDYRLNQLEPSITLLKKILHVYYNKSMTYIYTKQNDKALFLL